MGLVVFPATHDRVDTTATGLEPSWPQHVTHVTLAMGNTMYQSDQYMSELHSLKFFLGLTSMAFTIVTI